MRVSQEDFLLAEHVLRRKFATEEQVQECLLLLERLRGEMNLQETLSGILVKRGYLAPAQAAAVERDIHPERAASARNQIEGYRLLARIGAGAMGSVYKAQHLKLDIPVALKVLRIDLAGNATQIERLKREAQLAARLNHPNIVRPLDVGESNGFHYFSMEFVDGSTVRDLIQKKPLREQEALRITREVALALEHAHAQGVIHRDVKPGNIMITRDGAVKLADFGLARGQEPSDLTLDHAAIGTPHYIAPEQARRGADATARSDLFSLGASLYHMVTGRPPFSGDSLGEILHKVLRGEMDPPERSAPNLSLDTLYLIHRLMQQRPRDRYASATALLQDLDRLERGERVAPPQFRGDYSAFLQRRARRRLAFIAGGVALLAGAVAIGAARMREARESGERSRRYAVADRVGEEEAEKAADLASMLAAAGKMRQARADAGGGDRELPALALRIEKLGADIESVRKAEEALRLAAGPDPDFRAADLQVASLAAHFAGARARLSAIRESLRERSAAEAERAGRQVFSPDAPHADPQRTIEALRLLQERLESRLLPLDAEWVRMVPRQVAALEDLQREFQSLEPRRAEFLARLEAMQFGDARRTLDDWEAARSQARRRASEMLPDALLRPFPAETGLLSRLAEKERAAWREAEGRALAEMADRPWEARRILDGHRPSPETRQEWEKRLAEARLMEDALGKEQERLAGTAERLVLVALKEMRFGAVAAIVSGTRGQRTSWQPEFEGRLAVLDRLAERLERIRRRFLERGAERRDVRLVDETLRGARILPPEGDELDLFAVRAGAKSRVAGLKEFTRDCVLEVLGYDESSREERELRGHYLAAHALGLEDRRETCRRLEEVIPDLGADWAAAAEGWLRDERASQAEREQRAREANGKLDEALARKDWDNAAIFLKQLRESYRYTQCYEENRDGLQQIGATVRRYVGAGMLAREAGLPPAQVTQDAQTGVVRMVWDFRRWWPDEEKVAWNEGAARAWWRERLGRDFTEEAFRRGTLQLYAWSGLAADGESPGAQGPGNAAAEVAAGSPRMAELNNLLRRDADWSIEVTVEWSEPSPEFFALGCGQIWGCFVWVGQDASRGWIPFQEGFHGAKILFPPQAVKDAEKHMEEFRKRQTCEAAGKPWSEILRGGEPYRIRLERSGALLRLFAAPERQAGDRSLWIPLVERKVASAEELARAAGPFRILSHVPPMVRRVEVTGRLREIDG